MSKTEITYTKVGDYFIPDLTLPTEEEYPPLGKYGRMRLTYLKENHNPNINRRNYRKKVFSGKRNCRKVADYS